MENVEGVLEAIRDAPTSTLWETVEVRVKPAIASKSGNQCTALYTISLSKE
jgi:hypothetical protein